MSGKIMKKQIGLDSVMSMGEKELNTPTIQMKAHELLSSPQVWCQESPAEDTHGNKVHALHPDAVKWCALGAIQKTYSPFQWEGAMDSLLRALSVSEKGIAQLTKCDKACCLMEWNDDRQYSFEEIREILIQADV